MKTKKCFKCGEEKPLSEFYKHKEMCDGHLNKCKDCTKLDVKNHRAKNIEKIREYDRKRAKLPHRKNAAKEYRHTESGKNARRKAHVNYRKNNPEKYKAHNAVSNAVRDGKIAKPECCEVCGTICTPHGHHWSYKKEHWLDVQWLCIHCHIDVHHE